MNRRFQTLDVFTERKFTGNPLAVVVDGEGLSTDQMQTIAAEFNLAEATFVSPAENSENDASVRIFTPKSELPFAGHPTVGTAIVIAESLEGEGGYSRLVKLEEQVGLVPVRVTKEAGKPAYAQFTNAKLPEERGGLPSIEAFAAATNVPAEQIGFDDHELRMFDVGPSFVHLPVKTIQAVQNAEPDLAAWRQAGFPPELVGIYLYTRGGEEEGTHWHARMFAPDQGIPEDPATGSAVAGFPGQLCASEALSDGTHKWTVEQGYEMGRPSQIYLEADVAGGAVTEIRVGGYALPVMEGMLNL